MRRRGFAKLSTGPYILYILIYIYIDVNITLKLFFSSRRDHRVASKQNDPTARADNSFSFSSLKRR